jgi:hypothetical protein
MDSHSFDALIQAATHAPTRRGIVGLIAGAALSRLAWFDQTAAKKRRRRKGKKHHKRRRHHNTNQTPPSPLEDVPPPPPPPLPAPVITPDATCSQAPNGTSGTDGDSRLAHTFTAIGSGPLVRADLLLDKREGSNGDYVLRLSPVDGAEVPTNTVLAETSVANANVPVGESTVSFSFAAPFSIVSGTPYAVVLTRPGDDSFGWRFRNENPCAGRSFISTSQTGPFTTDNDDFIFATFVSS